MMTVLIHMADGSTDMREWDISTAKVREIDHVVTSEEFGITHIEILEVRP